MALRSNLMRNVELKILDYFFCVHDLEYYGPVFPDYPYPQILVI